MLYPVIISGGSGSRLWPISRSQHPKPYVELADGSTLIGKTLERAAQLSNIDTVYTIANQDHYFLATDCYEATGVNSVEHIFLLEAVGRNTAAAIALASIEISIAHGGDAIVLVLPADHVIEDTNAFQLAVTSAEKLAVKGFIVTFGMKPISAETGYGYIEMKEGSFSGFIEKPDKSTAEAYVKNGSYFWNSGMLCFKAGLMMSELEEHCPDVLGAVRDALESSASYSSDDRSTFRRIDKSAYSSSPDISIDYAVMEKSDAVACIVAECGWSDVGSWNSFSHFFESDEAGNRTHGEVLPIDSSNCIVQSCNRLISLVGVQDLIIADTPDALLISHKESQQMVKVAFEQLQHLNHPSATLNRKVHRPWGTYTVMEEGIGYKTKLIMVKPQQRLSLQAHYHRSEHWVVVSGTAKVVNGQDEILLTTNQSTYIPCGFHHRLENPGILPLLLVEVQIGDYLGEDDIVRFEDVYGRE